MIREVVRRSTRSQLMARRYRGINVSAMCRRLHISEQMLQARMLMQRSFEKTLSIVLSCLKERLKNCINHYLKRNPSHD